MRKTLVMTASILAFAVGMFAGESKYVLNYKRLSTRELGISCANGGDPTGSKIGDTLIISCGK